MTGLGNITLGVGGGGTESLIINAGTELAPVVLEGTILGNGANKGTITVNATKAVTFNGKIGHGQPIKAFTLADNSIVNLNANASVGNNGIVLAGADAAAAKLNVADGVTITGKVSGNGANMGIMKFAGAGVVTGQIGNGGALKEIIANGLGIVDLQHAGAVVATKQLTIAHDGADVRLAGGLTGATVFNANGLVKIAANGIVTGAVTTTSGGADGSLGGKLVFAAGGTVTGLIGTALQKLNKVEITGAGNLLLTEASANGHYAKTFNFGDPGSVMKVTGTGALNGDLVADVANSGQIMFLGAGEIKGRIGDTGGFAIAKVTSNAAAVVKIGAGDHKVNVLHLVDANSIFEFADGALITGTITTAAAPGGIANFTGSGKVTGTTGVGGNALATVNLNGVDDKVVKFGDTITATNVNIGAGTLEMNNAGNIAAITTFTDAGGRLLISGNAVHTVGQVVTGAVAGGKGTISIANGVGANAVTFAGQIGDRAAAGNSLKLLSIDSGDLAIFTAADSQIEAISVGANGWYIRV